MRSLGSLALDSYSYEDWMNEEATKERRPYQKEGKPRLSRRWGRWHCITPQWHGAGASPLDAYLDWQFR